MRKKFNLQNQSHLKKKTRRKKQEKKQKNQNRLSRSKRRKKFPNLLKRSSKRRRKKSLNLLKKSLKNCQIISDRIQSRLKSQMLVQKNTTRCQTSLSLLQETWIVQRVCRMLMLTRESKLCKSATSLCLSTRTSFCARKLTHGRMSLQTSRLRTLFATYKSCQRRQRKNKQSES